jgi:glucose/mannose transport system substrate-binding protein
MRAQLLGAGARITACVALFVIASCASDDGASSKAAPSGIVEIFSWWSGPEGRPLVDTLAAFTAKYENIRVINSALDSSGGVIARDIFNDRMARGEPPDTFQVQAGRALLDRDVLVNGRDASERRVEPLNSLYDANGWTDVIPPALRAFFTYDNEIYAVPIGLLRGNSLYYNARVLRENGVTPPASWADFERISSTLEAKGIIPLAIGTKDIWVVKDTWFYVQLGEMGGEDFRRFWSGLGAATDPRISTTTDQLDKILTHSNANPALVTRLVSDTARAAAIVSDRLTWDTAADLVKDGAAAMTIMGDWCKGYLTTERGMVPGVDLNVVPVPGTAGSFLALVDTFPLTRGAPHAENARLLLEFFGSREGQDLFNPPKGSISVRTDSDLTRYDVMSHDIARDLSSAKVVLPGIGGMAPEAFNVAFERAARDYWDKRGVDPAAGARALTDLFAQRYDALR